MTLRPYTNLTILFVTFSCLANSILYAHEKHEMILSCPHKHHNLIKGYKLHKKHRAITILLCDGSSVKPHQKPLPEQLNSGKYTYVAQIIVSANQQYIGWVTENYDRIPFILNVYANSNVHSFTQELPIWRWRYTPTDSKVIVETGSFHGMEQLYVDEYEIKTGHKHHLQDGKRLY